MNTSACTVSNAAANKSWYAPSSDFYSSSIDVEIDNNLYVIITEWVRTNRKFNSKDEILQALLNEYEDRYLRSNRCSECNQMVPNNQPNQSVIFKPKISTLRKYTSRKVYTELVFIYDTNRYHVQSLVSSPGCCCPCGHDNASCSLSVDPIVSMNVDEYIKNLVKTNYEQALIGLNKTSILMSLPNYINRNEFETKMRTICEVDITSYKLKSDLEVL